MVRFAIIIIAPMLLTKRVRTTVKESQYHRVGGGALGASHDLDREKLEQPGPLGPPYKEEKPQDHS
ncbi:MAG: hypothetical protein NWE88_00350 [Candidatus Bathyarchaeota archaeon]|nr:hypothetical protein [Candidatus Bathyarchaeota archaeon]